MAKNLPEVTVPLRVAMEMTIKLSLIASPLPSPYSTHSLRYICWPSLWMWLPISWRRERCLSSPLNGSKDSLWCLCTSSWSCFRSIAISFLILIISGHTTIKQWKSGSFLKWSCLPLGFSLLACSCSSLMLQSSEVFGRPTRKRWIWTPSGTWRIRWTLFIICSLRQWLSMLPGRALYHTYFVLFTTLS